MARRSKITEQWGVTDVGTLHAPGTRVCASREEAEKWCADDYDYATPSVRSLVTIDGVTFASAWVRKPTEAQRERHPKWPESVPMAM